MGKFSRAGGNFLSCFRSMRHSPLAYPAPPPLTGPLGHARCALGCRTRVRSWMGTGFGFCFLRVCKNKGTLSTLEVSFFLGKGCVGGGGGGGGGKCPGLCVRTKYTSVSLKAVIQQTKRTVLPPPPPLTLCIYNTLKKSHRFESKKQGISPYTPLKSTHLQ